jgi:hypothetical protein
VDTVGDYTNSEGNTTVTFDGHIVASGADSLSLTAIVTNQIADYDA